MSPRYYSHNPVVSDMRDHTRTYTYDELGNVEQESHAVIGSSHNRNNSYNSGVNTLTNIATGLITNS